MLGAEDSVADRACYIARILEEGRRVSRDVGGEFFIIFSLLSFFLSFSSFFLSSLSFGH